MDRKGKGGNPRFQIPGSAPGSLLVRFTKNPMRLNLLKKLRISGTLDDLGCNRLEQKLMLTTTGQLS